MGNDFFKYVEDVTDNAKTLKLYLSPKGFTYIPHIDEISGYHAIHINQRGLRSKEVLASLTHSRGVYILEIAGRRAYVGESDAGGVASRLRAHKDKHKHKLRSIFCFLPRDPTTPFSSKYLEKVVINFMRPLYGKRLLNKNNGTSVPVDSTIKEMGKNFLAFMRSDFFTAYLLPGKDLPAKTGDATTDIAPNPDGSNEFTFDARHGNIKAIAIADDDGHFILKAGSTMKIKESDGLVNTKKHVYHLRRRLVNNGIAVKNSEKTYVFKKDYQFSSISQLTSALDGQSRNGDGWKNRQGQTHNQWIKSKESI